MSSLASLATDTEDRDLCPSPQTLTEDQRELSKILRALRHDPSLMGCCALGRDGIMRSLTADRDVVDAVPLSSRHIKAFLDRMPFDQKIEDEYRGVDGTKVPREQWFHTDKSLLPQPLTEEQKEWSRKRFNKNKELLTKKLKGLENGTLESCPAVVRSDYNLGPRIADGQKRELTSIG